MDVIGTEGGFALFATMCILAYVWISRQVPETKGKAREEIEALIADRVET